MSPHASILALAAASMLVPGIGMGKRSTRTRRKRDTAQQDKRRAKKNRTKKARRQTRKDKKR
jgi:hypothetical protein